MTVAFVPPTGINYRCSDNIPALTLSKSLCKIASFLQNQAPYVMLTRYDDWWEHDGLHFERSNLDFHGLFEIIKTPRSLFESMQGDDRVFIGIAPDDKSWYLRFYLDWDDEDEHLTGRFDITVSKQLAVQLEDRVIKSLTVLPKLEKMNVVGTLRQWPERYMTFPASMFLNTARFNCRVWGKIDYYCVMNPTKKRSMAFEKNFLGNFVLGTNCCPLYRNQCSNRHGPSENTDSSKLYTMDI